MTIIYYSINKVLHSHLEKINPKSNLGFYGSIRNNNFDYIRDIFKFKLHSRKDLFIYNTSPANLLTSIISRLFGSNIIFHLHDPKPHSGILNPVIYLIQFVQLLFSNSVIVFDPLLIKTTIKYYPFISQKKLRVFPHGKPEFNYIKTNLNMDNINFGFFGRNMPYKNVNAFLDLSRKFSSSYFHVFGKGYDNLVYSKSNIRIIDRYIENDEYYSLMNKVDYVVIPYKDISFSGVISDAISLGKKMIVSEDIIRKYSHPLMIPISEFSNPAKQKSKNNIDGGWQDYIKNLKQL